MSVLSIHVDESGNTNLKDVTNPYYCFTFIFHNQDDDITEALHILDEKVKSVSSRIPFIHAAPLIRNDEPFDVLTPDERKFLFYSLYNFCNNIKFTHKSFFFDKTNFKTVDSLKIAMFNEISNFIDDNIDYFNAFDEIKIYYDFGQNTITSALHAFELKFDKKQLVIKYAKQENYRLLQVADFICTLEQINTRWKTNPPNKSVATFFGSRSKFRKNYYMKLRRKEFCIFFVKQ